MKFSEIVSSYLKFFGVVFKAAIYLSALDSILNLIFPINSAITSYVSTPFVAQILTAAVIATYGYVVERGIDKLYIPVLHAHLANHHEQYADTEKINAVKNVIWGVTVFVALQIIFSFAITFYMRDTTSAIIVGAPELESVEDARKAGDITQNRKVAQLNQTLNDVKKEETTAIANAQAQHSHLFAEMGHTNGWAEKKWAEIKNSATAKVKKQKENINAALLAAKTDTTTLLVVKGISRNNDYKIKQTELKAQSFSKLLMWIAVACLAIAILTGWIIANFNRAFDDGSFEQLIPKPKNVTQNAPKERVTHVSQEKQPQNTENITREVISRWCSDARLYFDRYVSQHNPEFKKNNFETFLKFKKKLYSVGIICKIDDNNELTLINEKEVKANTPKAQANPIEFDVVA